MFQFAPVMISTH